MKSQSLYRHVVFFKFKKESSEQTVLSIETAFRKLCERLPFVRAFEGGRNSSPEGLNEGFTHCFIVSFDDPAGRDTYLPHPEHQAFCRTFLDPNLDKVCVIDYQP